MTDDPPDYSAVSAEQVRNADLKRRIDDLEKENGDLAEENNSLKVAVDRWRRLAAGYAHDHDEAVTERDAARVKVECLERQLFRANVSTDWEMGNLRGALLEAEKKFKEFRREVAVAVLPRVAYGHNDTCGVALSEDSLEKYPCSCGHDELASLAEKLNVKEE